MLHSQYKVYRSPLSSAACAWLSEAAQLAIACSARPTMLCIPLVRIMGHGHCMGLIINPHAAHACAEGLLLAVT